MATRTVSANPEVLGGTPVFAGTRVPVQTFIEYIKAGDSIETFLEGFPSVKREQLLAFLDETRDLVLASVH
ncbi:MAG TPA: DUF433 domain-containing protein [Candidatus Angelobacter sp.]|jgi:uncharacterized protein (DUF433 family)